MNPFRLAQGPRRTALRLGLGVLGVLLLLGVLRRVTWGPFQAALAELRWPFLAATLVTAMVAIALRAWRLGLILAVPGRFGPVLRSVALGYLGTALLPLGGGELLKMGALRHYLGLTTGAAAAGWLLDRVLDLLGLALMLGVLAVAGMAVRFRAVQAGVLAWGLGLGAALLVSAWLVWRRLGQPPPPQGPFRRGSRLRRALGEFTALLGTLRNPAFLARLALLQGLITALDAAGIWVSFRIFAFAAGLPPLVALKTTVCLTLGAVLPLLPGGVGTHQAACLLALGPAGLSTAQALAYSVVVQTATLLLILSLGTLAALRPGSAAARPQE